MLAILIFFTRVANFLKFEFISEVDRLLYQVWSFEDSNLTPKIVLPLNAYPNKNVRWPSGETNDSCAVVGIS